MHVTSKCIILFIHKNIIQSEVFQERSEIINFCERSYRPILRLLYTEKLDQDYVSRLGLCTYPQCSRADQARSQARGRQHSAVQRDQARDLIHLFLYF